MDQELVEYLDRRFNQFRDEVLQDLRTELRHGLRDGHEQLRAELRQELGDGREQLRAELRQELGDGREQLRAELRQDQSDFRQDVRGDIAASAAETRRHFDVVAEQLMGKIQLVAEGVIAVDQKVDRLGSEMRTKFQRVDRRFLHLEARIVALRD